MMKKILPPKKIKTRNSTRKKIDSQPVNPNKLDMNSLPKLFGRCSCAVHGRKKYLTSPIFSKSEMFRLLRNGFIHNFYEKWELKIPDFRPVAQFILPKSEDEFLFYKIDPRRRHEVSGITRGHDGWPDGTEFCLNELERYCQAQGQILYKPRKFSPDLGIAEFYLTWLGLFPKRCWRVH